jgi:site-specific recombinase XerD
MIKESEFDPVTEGYLEYVEAVRKLRHRTITDMKCTYRKLAAYVENNRPGEMIWQLNLDGYIMWVGEARNQGKKPKCLNKHLSHVRGLLEYAWQSGRLDRNVLDGFIIKDAYRKKEPAVLSLREAEKLVETCSTSTAHERRSRLMVLLLYGCGPRTSELAKLNVQDIDRERQELVILHGKAGKQRRIPIPEGVWMELLAYLAERGGKLGPLFKTEAKKKRISTREISDTIRELGEKAGIEDIVTPRVLRHTFATHLMDAGVDIGVISMLMGHRSPRETGVYLHALDGSKRAAMESSQRRNSYAYKEEEK